MKTWVYAFESIIFLIIGLALIAAAAGLFVAKLIIPAVISAILRTLPKDE